ncbi:YkgJ family cysteine cluster protein [Methanococcoides sp. FTZ1]|uniref:YkgJ family cysteine cluster protein n=1 Tax=Methanococcoides sp. FTZ1 TaxID=3439061 RepID=UPI003F86F5A2
MTEHFSEYRQSLIRALQEELEAAGSIPVEDIASQIRDIGFSCSMCGSCCKRSGGDNRVFLTSADLELLESCPACPEDAAVPMVPDGMDMSSASSVLEHLFEFDIDIKGRLHTFGWMLKRKDCGDCFFISEDGSNRCSIYGNRSMLCRTYPFYIEGGKLQTSECEGLGNGISYEDSLVLAGYLVERYITEIKDTILLYENFEEIQSSAESVEVFNKNLSDGVLAFVVHDCTGMSIFSRKLFM